MAAPILVVDLEHPQPRHLARAVQALRDDGVIAYPTDTYYGLGCSLQSRKGIDRLFQLKQRERTKPLSFLCADLSDVSKYAKVANFAYRIMRQLTPGPFTFVLEATRLVPDIMMTRQKQVAIRVPDATLARALAAELGNPLVTTSATTHDGEPMLDGKDIKAALGNGLDLILDAGPQPLEPSTVVLLVNDQIEIARQGKGRIDIKM